MRKPIVVNLLGAPCAGKSTMAAGLFYRLKLLGINAELTGEYAKDLTYSGRFEGSASLEDQIYIFAKQRARIERLVPHCEIIVTDCPLLIGISYYREHFPDCFRELLLWAFNQHDNLNFFLTRANPYSEHGRRQSEDEAQRVHDDMFTMLRRYQIHFSEVPGNDAGLEHVLKAVLEARASAD